MLYEVYAQCHITHGLTWNACTSNALLPPSNFAVALQSTFNAGNLKLRSRAANTIGTLQVSKSLVDLYKQCLAGDFSLIQRLSSMASGAQQSAGFAVRPHHGWLACTVHLYSALLWVDVQRSSAPV